ncbi:uncharacterized protein LACBIDRAFT_298435 [Laccaria bicolor S238N-H82]|uniref:Predicted protein n=1 Tax=Laccaria bicolor (strain S238N-H82 / ATCC MYA-4686) TaxID=486041 RepID=B0DCU9_LACBS|nr:uncharacterized protein LACBIDRAFT_298435 [Laccaria bicolor S238N-H82]EDR07359.1 predicted protein [Laccaria bicolor S238N-H82]|eukprot:XP_001881751.1 predicted protein [Laccaria bicolor S238N-H82]
MSYARREPASVASLPAELLLHILKNVYVDSRQGLGTFWPHEWCESLSECNCKPNEPYLTKWNDNTDLKSSSLFPYALSSVCKTWHDVMLLVPAFWTRLVIFLDDQPTAIAELRSHLSASRDLPFRAHIFNREDAISQDTAERAQVRAVVNELSPHLHRCEQLTFDVMHNSSLPSICHTFSGSFPLLTELSMRCRIYDEPEAIDSQGEDNRDPFLFPNLTSISLTGSAFVDANKNPDSGMGKKLRLFSLSHLSSFDDPGLTLTGLMHILNKFDKISSLELKHIDLPYNPNEQIPRGSQLRVHFDTILLEGFKRATFEAFNRFIGGGDSESLTIRACELAGNISDTVYLTLEDIHSTEDLLSVIPTLSNHWFTFTSCSGLNDACLELLSKPDPSTGQWNVETLSSLSISGCPGISVRALKELVEGRKVEATARGYETNPHYDDFDEVSPIESLNVYDCGLEFSPEDAQWFKENIGSFYFRS